MPATRSELVERIRIRADMVRSKFVSDSDIEGFITKEYKALYDLIVGTGQDHFLGDPVIKTIAAGASTFDVPDDFYKLVGLDRDVGGGRYRPLQPFNFAERDRLGNDNSAAEGNYRLWYYPRLSPLDGDGDELSAIVDPWDEFIVCGGAITCLGIEESDPSLVIDEKADITRRIQALAPTRDVGMTDRVTDVTSTAFNDRFTRLEERIRYRVLGAKIYVYVFNVDGRY